MKGQIVHILGFVGHTCSVIALLSLAVVAHKLSQTVSKQMDMTEFMKLYFTKTIGGQNLTLEL